jgi:hypothetical protein
MIAAVALRKENSAEQPEPLQSRSEVLARYRHLREIGKRHHSDVLKFLTPDAILRGARRLGLARGRTFILDSMDELTLAFDMAIYTGPADRSRAIDRYARSAKLVPGSDEDLMLAAMCDARCAIVVVERQHPSAGLIVRDMFRNTDLWLVDEGLEMSMPEGCMIATRYYVPVQFAMTAGVIVPVDPDLLEDAIMLAPHLLRKSQLEAIDDRRFAEAIYRTALADGVMEKVTYLDPDSPADAE